MSAPAAAAPDVDQYFAQHVIPGLAARAENGDKANFLNEELEKWERAELRLEEWAHRNDGTPNPYSPPLSAFQTALIIVRLNALLEQLRDQIRAAIAAAQA